MIFRDMHTHTKYCDGKDTPENMVNAAIEKGLSCIGFSGHCYTFFDERYCMSIPNVAKYIAEINLLKSKYKDLIKIKCGVEQDYFSNFSLLGFDYIIGSVHYLKKGDEYIPLDESKEILIDAVNKYYGGDFYALAEEYFALVANVVLKTDADIIGHFDLISKFNEDGSLFDENNERYVAAYQAAIDNLIPYGKPFEINTGAISRGYRTKPYPSMNQLKYIAENGGFATLSSDAHSKEGIANEFEKWYDECIKIGIEIK